MPYIKADTLRRMRRTQGYSAEDLAFELVLTREHYTQKEHGDAAFTDWEMGALSKILNVRKEALFPQEEYVEHYAKPLRFETYDEGNRTHTESYWESIRRQVNVQVGEPVILTVNGDANFNKDVFDNRSRDIPGFVHSLYDTFFVVETMPHHVKECFFYTQLLRGKGIRRAKDHAVD